MKITIRNDYGEHSFEDEYNDHGLDSMCEIFTNMLFSMGFRFDGEVGIIRDE